MLEDLTMRCCVTNMRMPIERWVDITVYEFITKFSTFADGIYIGYFPTLNLINRYLSLGEQNEGMGNNALWHPFCLTQCGYNELINKIKQKQNTLIILDSSISLKDWHYNMINLKKAKYSMSEPQKPIKFYLPKDEYGDFSNFSKHGILMNNMWWSTVEHYYQAQKFNDIKYQEKIRSAETPKIASILGRNKKRKIKDKWEEIKDYTMYEAVYQKFTTHKELKNLLLSTGNRNIIENSPSDYYWGCGVDGWGKNKLGKILEQVREELRNV